MKPFEIPSRGVITARSDDNSLEARIRTELQITEVVIYSLVDTDGQDVLSLERFYKLEDALKWVRIAIESLEAGLPLPQPQNNIRKI